VTARILSAESVCFLRALGKQWAAASKLSSSRNMGIRWCCKKWQCCVAVQNARSSARARAAVSVLVRMPDRAAAHAGAAGIRAPGSENGGGRGAMAVAESASIEKLLF